MASMARQIARDPFPFGFPGLVRAVAWPRGTQTGDFAKAVDDPTSRALAATGLAALVALPFLLLCSVVLAAPLAVPAAIGACYLAASRALSVSRPRRANLINAGVLLGLVGWPIGLLLAGGASLTHQGVTAALIAPLFAAAPALARFVIFRTSCAAAEPELRNLALTRVGDIEKVALTQQLLMLDRDATVLAVSEAARRELGLLPDAFEHALTGLLNTEELSHVLESIGRCRKEGKPISLDLTFEALDTEVPLRATLTPCCSGLVEMRLHKSRSIRPQLLRTGLAAHERHEKTGSIDILRKPTADIGEAMVFALHRASRKAEAKRVQLTSAIQPGIAVTCDRQVGRRIGHVLIDNALSTCAGDSVTHIVARRLKGVALLRIITSPRMRATGIDLGRSDKVDLSALETLVDGIGGTVVSDEQGGKNVVSVRLPLAPGGTRGEAAA